MKEIINVTYYDPRNSIFKGSSKDREKVTVFSCDNHENCDAFKNGTCVMLNLADWLRHHRCPHGAMNQLEGYTKSARHYGELLARYKQNYSDRLYKLNNIKHVEKLGDYWFLNLCWLDLHHRVNSERYKTNPEYETSFDKYFKEKIEYTDLVKDEDFNAELFRRLIDFRPQRIFDNSTIKEYYEEKIPQFFYDLRKYFPDKYAIALKECPEVEELVKKVTFVGKNAKLSTLSPGEVFVNKNKFYWDGEKIETTADKAHMWGKLKDAKVIIYPADNSVVEIIDDATVNENTVFV